MRDAIQNAESEGLVRKEDGGVITGAVDTMEQAVNQVCLDLDSTHLTKGVISKGEQKGGYMLVTTQELGEV